MEPFKGTYKCASFIIRFSVSSYEQLNKMNIIQKTLKDLKKLLIIICIPLFLLSLSAESSFFDQLSKEKILPVDEAFVFEAYSQKDGIILSWSMKENCFLYKDKFEILTSSETKLSILTSGESERINDVYFGEVDVFFNSVKKKLNLDPAADFIEVSYQGCNEQGFCYPVVSKRIDINKLVDL